MFNVILYLVCIFVWGCSWFAIKFQMGDVPPVQTVFYRFALSTAILFIALALTRRLKLYSFKDHIGFAGMGLFMFSLNYWLFYVAIDNGLTTGLEAVIFSLLVVGNIINARLFYGDRMTLPMVIGAMVGILGVVCLFSDEIFSSHETQGITLGIILAVVATYSASLGNMVSRKIYERKVSALGSSAWGMAYGSLFLFITAWWTTPHFTFSLDTGFLLSYGYLSLFASVIGFWAYLTLLGRIGSSRAAYATIIFPIVALILSSFFEDYSWNVIKYVGVVLAILGNLIVLGKISLRRNYKMPR